MRKKTQTPKSIKISKRRIKLLYKKRKKWNIKNRTSNREYGHLSKKTRNHARKLRIDKKRSKIIRAPTHLSLVKNTEETLSFISQLDESLKKREPVLVDLQDVTKLSLNGVLVLLSVMMAFKASRIRFNGTFPKDQAAKDRLSDSGFFQKLYNNANTESTKRKITIEQKDTISTHADKKVDSALADELLTKATKTVWGEKRRCKGAQISLVEMMLNTNNHACPIAKGGKHWWLCVSLNKENKTASFAFVDYGVGIFESLKTKKTDHKFFQPLQRLYRELKDKYKYANNAHIMSEILAGRLHRTSTGKPYHGKGLPSIYNAAQTGKISNLHIISNDVFVDQAAQNFREIKREFSGTFIYFEINPNCHNLSHEP